MSDGVIFDRGYRTYDGPRRGPAGARRAVYKEGLKRIFGIGRKARAKIFPWTMMGIALITAIVIVGAHFAIGNIAEALAQGLPSYGELFDAYSWISLIFIAYAGPQLLIPDRSSGVLSVYFSRPLTVDGYLAAKSLAFTTVVGAMYLVPQIVLHLGLGLISSDGFLTYMGDHIDVLWKVPVTALGFIAMHGALVFFFSSIIRRPGIASSALLGTVVAGNGIARQIALADFPAARWISLVAPDQHPRIIRDHLFGGSGGYPAELAGFEVWASVISIVVVVAAAAWFVRSRYRRLA